MPITRARWVTSNTVAPRASRTGSASQPPSRSWEGRRADPDRERVVGEHLDGEGAGGDERARRRFAGAADVDAWAGEYDSGVMAAQDGIEGMRVAARGGPHHEDVE